VRSGGGFLGWHVKGKRVAFTPTSTNTTGSWGEYALLNATDVIAIPDDVSFETAATSVVNPLTALTMLETV
jgi:NADPH:quinone reductase-like Zn-dependent oxidoreductase